MATGYLIGEVEVTATLLRKTVGRVPQRGPVQSSWQAGLVETGMRLAGGCGSLLQQLLGSRAGHRLGILTYHRTARHIHHAAPPAHNVDPDRFRQQLLGLLEQGWKPWPLSRVLEYQRTQREIPPHVFVVTFDDGFATLYTEAWPVLQELNIPATVFLNTAYLDSLEPFPFDDWGLGWQHAIPLDSYRPLSTEECLEMLSHGLIELGAHTHTHRDFRGRPGEFQHDLQINLKELDHLFAVQQPPFAFPFGSPRLGFAGGELERVARLSGVSCSLTQRPALVDPTRDDPFRWGRLNVFAWDTAATLAGKLGGWYSWAPKLRQKFSLSAHPSAWMLTLQTMQGSGVILE